MRHLLGAATLALTLLGTPSAFAYDYLSQCGPTWTNLPIPYYINSVGSADLPFATVQTVIRDSFDVWGDPCCSQFAASYQGTTQQTAVNPGSLAVVLSWTENAWDPALGNVNSVIGVTFPRPGFNCTLVEAPILFNGVGFRFSTNGSATDLQSIATHEVGHLLGLDHSNITGTTMFASYNGGTGARSLHQDDVNGVCSLYYTTACSCSSTSQCGTGEQCISGLCRPPLCTSDASCDPGLSCLPNGDCGIPPCNTDADCGADFSCQGGTCLSACPVCRRCDSNEDCGNNGFCTDLGDGPRCWVSCGPTVGCPGDSVCFTTDNGQGGTAYVCGSGSAQMSGGLCLSGSAVNPTDYVCRDDGISDQCRSGADCEAGQRCVSTAMGRRCETPPDPCLEVTCGAGLVCFNGFCIRDDSTPTNNTTGPTNNTTGPTNNTPGNNAPGNNTTGPTMTNAMEEDPTIVIFAEEKVDDTGCSAVTSPRNAPVGLLLFGAFIWSRRRR